MFKGRRIFAGDNQATNSSVRHRTLVREHLTVVNDQSEETDDVAALNFVAASLWTFREAADLRRRRTDAFSFGNAINKGGLAGPRVRAANVCDSIPRRSL